MKILLILNLFLQTISFARAKSYYFKIEVFNINTNELKTYKINDTDFFEVPETLSGWNCHLKKVNPDGFKPLICKKKDDLISVSVGCGLNDDRVNTLQLQDFTKHKNLAFSIKLICPAEQLN